MFSRVAWGLHGEVEMAPVRTRLGWQTAQFGLSEALSSGLTRCWQRVRIRQLEVHSRLRAEAPGGTCLLL